MNKLYFLMLLCLIFNSSAIAQTTYETNVNDGNWTTQGTWKNNVIPSTTTGGVIRILPGHILTISSTISFSSDVILEVYGTLKFIDPTGGQGTGDKGRLNLTDNSIIKIAVGGLIVTDGADNVWITMGGSSAKLQGDELNGIPGPNEITRDNINKRGCKFVANCSFTPLPVELLYFKSTTQPHGIHLEWASAKEWNFSHYTVERSVDGKEFVPIHTEYVSGDSHSTKTYSYLDAQPLYGANYYRLKATDIDATEEYKGMALAYAGTKGELRVYPNPAKGGVIVFKNPGAMEGTWLSVTGSSGREIMRIQMSEQELRLPASVLTSGVYIVKVWNKLEVKQARLVIQ